MAGGHGRQRLCGSSAWLRLLAVVGLASTAYVMLSVPGPGPSTSADLLEPRPPAAVQPPAAARPLPPLEGEGLELRGQRPAPDSRPAELPPEPLAAAAAAPALGAASPGSAALGPTPSAAGLVDARVALAAGNGAEGPGASGGGPRAELNVTGEARSAGSSRSEEPSVLEHLHRAYLEQLHAAPLAFGAALGAVLYAAGDGGLQALEKLQHTSDGEAPSLLKQNFQLGVFSPRRMSVAAAVGAALLGFVLPVWYRFLDEQLPGSFRALDAVSAKACLSFAVVTPLLAAGSHAAAFESSLTHSRTWDDTVAQRSRAWAATHLAARGLLGIAVAVARRSVIWPFHHALCFLVLPLELRAPATCVVAVLWSMALALLFQDAPVDVEAPVAALSPEAEAAEAEARAAAEAAAAWREAFEQASGANSLSATFATAAAAAGAGDGAPGGGGPGVGGGGAHQRPPQAPALRPDMVPGMERATGMPAHIQENLLKTIQKSAPPMIQEFLMANAKLFSQQTEQLLPHTNPGQAPSQEEQQQPQQRPLVVQARVVQAEDQDFENLGVVESLEQMEEEQGQEEEDDDEATIGGYPPGTVGALAEILNSRQGGRASRGG